MKPIKRAYLGTLARGRYHRITELHDIPCYIYKVYVYIYIDSNGGSAAIVGRVYGYRCVSSFPCPKISEKNMASDEGIPIIKGS